MALWFLRIMGREPTLFPKGFFSPNSIKEFSFSGIYSPSSLKHMTKLMRNESFWELGASADEFCMNITFFCTVGTNGHESEAACLITLGFGRRNQEEKLLDELHPSFSALLVWPSSVRGTRGTVIPIWPTSLRDC